MSATAGPHLSFRPLVRNRQAWRNVYGGTVLSFPSFSGVAEPDEMNLQIKPLVLFLLISCSCSSGTKPAPRLSTIMSGANAHPRIWLDSTTLTRLTALKNANDPTWVNLKADADAFAADTVEAYNETACTGNDICYAYEGYGWLTALEPLALAYQMTGSTTYSNKVKQILTSFANAGSAPCQVDSGYGSRSAVLALALGYDWVYPTLSAADKTAITTALDACWTWVQVNGYQWAPALNPVPYGNYFGGHLLGYGLAALAVEGDDANAVAMQTAVLNNFTTYVVPAFTTGAFSGGYGIESYSYGGGNFVRLFQYMKAMTTAGKTDLWNNYIAYPKLVAKNYIHEVFPDNYTITNEGQWSGLLVGFVFPQDILDLQGLLTGTTEGGWMLKLYNNDIAAIPAAIPGPPNGNYTIGNFDLFLYNTGQVAVDFTATQPTYLFSPIDYHTLTRTDWTTSAVMTTFSGGIGNYGDHQNRAGGNILIKRGADPLLVDGGMWGGNPVNGAYNGVLSCNGAACGDNEDFYASWQRNTLFFYDGGAHCFGDSNGNNEKYQGCQQGWPTLPNAVAHSENAGFVYQKSQMASAYQDNNFVGSVSDYERSFVNISGISFVFDRISAPSTSTRKLYWHTTGRTSQTPQGSAIASSLSGGVASVTVGSSKLWIDTLLPASPAITQEQGRTFFVNALGVVDGTQHFIVSDPNASSCSTNCLFLTVLAPTASSVVAMPTTSLISTATYRGAIYNDGVTPRVVLFSADGTAQTGVTYTASYSASLTGRHVITDLNAGAYNVIKDGTTIYSGMAVGSDGSLSFATTGGATYVIQASGAPAALAPAPPTGLRVTVR